MTTKKKTTKKKSATKTMTRSTTKSTGKSAARGGAATGKASGVSVRFRTTLNQAEGMNATGIIIPGKLIEQLGAGKRPPVRVNVNGYEYRSTVGVMGGKAMVGVSAAIRKETGLEAGDTLDVELTVDGAPRAVTLPPDFAKALAARPSTRAFFDALPNSLQRYHIDTINGAKTDETRQRRIEKAVALFRAGKKR